MPYLRGVSPTGSPQEDPRRAALRARLLPAMTAVQFREDRYWEELDAAAERLRRSPRDLIPERRSPGAADTPGRVRPSAAWVGRMSRINGCAFDDGRVHGPLIELRHRALTGTDAIEYLWFVASPDPHDRTRVERIVIATDGAGDVRPIYNFADQVDRVVELLLAWRGEREADLLRWRKFDWLTLGVLDGSAPTTSAEDPAERGRTEDLTARLSYAAAQAHLVPPGTPLATLVGTVRNWAVAEAGLPFADTRHIAVSAAVEALEERARGLLRADLPSARSSPGAAPAAVHRGSQVPSDVSEASAPPLSILVEVDRSSFQSPTGSERSGGYVRLRVTAPDRQPVSGTISRMQYEVLTKLTSPVRRADVGAGERGRGVARRAIAKLRSFGIRARLFDGAGPGALELVDILEIKLVPTLRDQAAALRRFRDASRGEAMRRRI